MKEASKLLAINNQFYQANALSFSATRQRLQPGVQRLVERVLLEMPMGRLLDLGCGNGWLGRFLLQKNFKGTYVGLDASPDLLEDAQRNSPYVFIQADLADPGWEAGLPAEPFDAILSFAVLHHLPGDDLRQMVLEQAHSHLAIPGGFFFHSEWQFQNSARLARRILPWETVGLQASDVDEGDALIDWRAEGRKGIRYVHQFSEEELQKLAHSASFQVTDTIYSDGREGNLGLYQAWAPL
jgi:tRNA (uracil-5-)-methyltransferase TRM9